MRLQAFVLLCGVVYGVAAVSYAQREVIEMEGVTAIRSLSGHVFIGPEEVAANGVTVELCSPDWKEVLASTKTDEKGYFSFGRVHGKIFYLGVSAPGVNSLRMRVRLDKHATRDLVIHVENST